jgi:hypothetical protein
MLLEPCLGFRPSSTDFHTHRRNRHGDWNDPRRSGEFIHFQEVSHDILRVGIPTEIVGSPKHHGVLWPML